MPHICLIDPDILNYNIDILIQDSIIFPSQDLLQRYERNRKA